MNRLCILFFFSSSEKDKPSCLKPFKSEYGNAVFHMSNKRDMNFARVLTTWIMLFFSGHCFYQSSQCCLCLPLGKRHDRRKYLPRTGITGNCTNLPLPQLQVNISLLFLLLYHDKLYLEGCRSSLWCTYTNSYQGLLTFTQSRGQGMKTKVGVSLYQCISTP